MHLVRSGPPCGLNGRHGGVAARRAEQPTEQSIERGHAPFSRLRHRRSAARGRVAMPIGRAGTHTRRGAATVDRVGALGSDGVAILDHLPFRWGGADVSVTLEQQIPLSGIRGHRQASALAEIDRRRAEDRYASVIQLEESVSQRIFWHRELPPLDGEVVAEHFIDAHSDHVPGGLSHRDELWAHCHATLMAHATSRLEQEVDRLGGDYAHVLDESIDSHHDPVTDTAWLQGRFAYVLLKSRQRG